jgi:hypothetical protein
MPSRASWAVRAERGYPRARRRGGCLGCARVDVEGMAYVAAVGEGAQSDPGAWRS